VALLTKAANGRPDGALAQLVERYTGSVEVRGSTPLGSTTFLLHVMLPLFSHPELVSGS
jgi:hypothetical protein